MAYSPCGTCIMCCKALGVEEIAKPAGKWCSLAKPGCGCTQYETRPPSCKEYECLWLQMHTSGKPLPLELRPDKSKVVIDVQTNGLWYAARVSGDNRHAWREPAMLGLLKSIVDTDPKHVVFLVIDGGEAKPLMYRERPQPLTSKVLNDADGT